MLRKFTLNHQIQAFLGVPKTLRRNCIAVFSIQKAKVTTTKIWQDFVSNLPGSNGYAMLCLIHEGASPEVYFQSHQPKSDQLGSHGLMWIHHNHPPPTIACSPMVPKAMKSDLRFSKHFLLGVSL